MFREADAPDLATSPNLRLNKSFVEEAVIPAFVYSVLPAVPPADTRTVATRLVLIGSERLSNLTVRRVLEEVFGPDVRNFASPALNLDLLNSSFQFERHPGTDVYLASLKPFDVDGAFSTYARIGEVWGLIIALYFAGSKGLKMLAERKVRTQKKSVGDFIGEILTVEAAATASCTNAERIALDQQLSDIKKAALELHLAERLEGSDHFPALLATLADARTRIWGVASTA